MGKIATLRYIGEMGTFYWCLQDKATLRRFWFKFLMVLIGLKRVISFVENNQQVGTDYFSFKTISLFCDCWRKFSPHFPKFSYVTFGTLLQQNVGTVHYFLLFQSSVRELVHGNVRPRITFHATDLHVYFTKLL